MFTHAEALICVGLIAALMAAYGAMEVAFPARVMQLLRRTGGLDRWLRQGSERRPALWQHRIAGILILLMAGWIGWSLAGNGGGSQAQVQKPQRAGPRPGPAPLALIIAIALIGGGLYFLTKPRALLRWATRTRSDRDFTDEGLRRGAVGARVFAVAMILVGVTALLLWLRAM